MRRNGGCPGRLHEATSVQSCSAHRFCLGSEGRRQDGYPRRIRHFLRAYQRQRSQHRVIGEFTSAGHGRAENSDPGLRKHQHCRRGTPAQFPLGVVAIPTKVQWPYMQQWHFDVQHEVARNTVATVSYVGSKGTHLTPGKQFEPDLPDPAESESVLRSAKRLAPNDCTISDALPSGVANHWVQASCNQPGCSRLRQLIPTSIVPILGYRNHYPPTGRSLLHLPRPAGLGAAQRWQTHDQCRLHLQPLD